MEKPNFHTVVPSVEMKGDDDEDTAFLQQMLPDAENYLLSHDWIKGISERYFGLGVGGVVAVFLFKIVPTRKEIDEWF